MAKPITYYLREDKMPHIWCEGCGHGIVLGAFIRAVDSLGLDKNNVCVVSGIGCASRAPGYWILIPSTQRMAGPLLLPPVSR